MNISSVDTSGVMTGASATVSAPVKTTGSPQSAQTAGGDLSTAQVKQMVADMQSQLDSMNVSLQYTLYGAHDKKIAVKVVDKGTGDVIREIPPKAMQALQSKMSELVGMIFNEKG
ncbi:MAG: flagellar protein FlaG [Deltaproteobacteria bacterium]